MIPEINKHRAWLILEWQVHAQLLLVALGHSKCYTCTTWDYKTGCIILNQENDTMTSSTSSLWEVCFFLSFCWPTRDHIGRSTKNFNPVMISSADGAEGWSDHRFRAPLVYTAHCYIFINTEPTTNFMGGIINPRPWHGRCRAGYSNTGGPPLPKKGRLVKKEPITSIGKLIKFSRL